MMNRKLQPIWLMDAAGTGVCALLLMLAYGLAVQPRLTAQKQREVHAATVQQKQAQLDDLHATGDALAHELAQLEQSVDRNAVSLRPLSQLNRHVADIAQLAADHGLELTQVRTTNAAAQGRFNIVQISMAGLGRFSDCVAFLHQLRSQFPDTGITGFQMQDQSADAKPGCAFTFDLAWFAGR